MTQDTEDLAARLAALEGTTAKARASKRPSPLAAILGITGIAALGGLVLSRICAAPSARLSQFPFEGDRAFPA